VHAGDLGDLTLGLVTLPYVRPQTYYDSAAWRGTWTLDGGGVLMNQGIHLVDLLLWYLGDPVAVQAHADTLQRRIDVEDTLAATLRFGNGALATITATTTAAPGFPHRLELYGTQGGIQVEGEGVHRWNVVDTVAPRVEPMPSAPPEGAGSGGDPRGIAPTGHIGILRNFIAAIREGTPLLVDGLEGRRSLAAVLAVYEAAGLLP
jgi:predicted dehydrogenase